MEKPGKRLDLDSELGMTRRDLIRRGAIVGGTLLWVAPAIQSISPAVAQAQEAGASNACATCYCRWVRGNGRFIADKCYSDGVSGILASDAACEANCKDPNNPDVPPNAALASTLHDYCSGTTNCSCISGRTGPPIANRTVCS